MSGFWAGDSIAQAIDSATDSVIHANRIKRLNKRIQEITEAKTQAEETNAANLAEKYALRVALSRLDPKHPLITNKSLQERVQDAGSKALAITGNYDAAREAGQTFKY